MIYTVQVFSQMNLFFSFLVFVLFCFFANSYIVISGWIWHVLSKRAASPAVKLSLFPVVFSIFHSLIPTLFPWNMGYPWLWGGLWGLHTAELWGFRFLNTLFYVFNLLFLIVFYHLRKKPLEKNQPLNSYLQKIKRRLASYYFDPIALKSFVSVTALFVFLNLLGFYLRQRLPEPDQKLKVIVVQYDHKIFSHKESKPRFKNKDQIFFDLKTLTYRSLKSAVKKKIPLKDIDFILWPEGSHPYPVKKTAKTDSRIYKMIETIKIPVLTGGVSVNKDNTIENSVFVFDRKASLLKPIYSKVKLVIFGEYFPLIDRFPILRKVFPYFGNSMVPGKILEAQELEGVSYAWQICYEILFDKFTRSFANQNAQVLINLSNDSWYGFWQQPYQHLAMSFARAIEVRRPLIRSTNTGFSGVIFANGEIKKLSPLNKAWFGLYEVPYYKTPPQTLFMRWGYFVNEIFLSFLALLIGVLHFRGYFFHKTLKAK